MACWNLTSFLKFITLYAAMTSIIIVSIIKDFVMHIIISNPQFQDYVHC